MKKGICPWCGKTVDKFIMFRGDVVGCRYCGIHTKQTNADCIREMTDEELAEFIWGVETDGRAYGCRGKAAWLKWLQQEATDES